MTAGAGEQRWRFFHGDWNEEPRWRGWSHQDVGQLTWDAACVLAREVFSQSVGDDCAACRVQATEELERLAAAAPGTRFEGSFDGDDVMIVVDDGRVAASDDAGSVGWSGWQEMGFTSDVEGTPLS